MLGLTGAAAFAPGGSSRRPRPLRRRSMLDAVASRSSRSSRAPRTVPARPLRRRFRRNAIEDRPRSYSGARPARPRFSRAHDTTEPQAPSGTRVRPPTAARQFCSDDEMQKGRRRTPSASGREASVVGRRELVRRTSRSSSNLAEKSWRKELGGRSSRLPDPPRSLRRRREKCRSEGHLPGVQEGGCRAAAVGPQTTRPHYKPGHRVPGGWWSRGRGGREFQLAKQGRGARRGMLQQAGSLLPPS
jgi:hypothetical protein